MNIVSSIISHQCGDRLLTLSAFSMTPFANKCPWHNESLAAVISVAGSGHRLWLSVSIASFPTGEVVIAAGALAIGVGAAVTRESIAVKM